MPIKAQGKQNYIRYQFAGGLRASGSLVNDANQNLTKKLAYHLSQMDFI